MEDKKVYLTIHGHFYQPPRENPWIDAVEVQESAKPFHDWNERISAECYCPNSSAKIVSGSNRVIDLVNNYSYMSFNIGPTLLSQLEKFFPDAYKRIIQADKESAERNHGHGNAMAQVYNHIIMPLANKNDKYTQVLWGIRDFQKRFGRAPEGMWLAETACDDETMEVLIDCGIKFTVLSPYQAKRIRPAGTENWQDVSDGRIDPARAYRYHLKSNPDKYIDLFFYDGAISKSAAFDNLLSDGNKFIARLKEGVSSERDYNQLVHIATDGESYGHHTKFGDMALAYVLKVRAEQEGFIITNYADYLELEPPKYEADIKDVSSWSCAHGVERWRSDCGCSTGGAAGWNQKWRTPLRNALDYLRDELIKIYEENASKYLNDVWRARNEYIDVILDRCEDTIKEFIEKNQKYALGEAEIVNVLKLLEMQRSALLMYTSCGWFFNEISGIETTQIMKYALHAIELARCFSDKDLETGFTAILSEAESNITVFGTGKDIYEKFVKPASVPVKNIAALWAISAEYRHFDETEELYCFKIKKDYYRHYSKGSAAFSAGKIEIQSKITLEKTNLYFALIKFLEGDFHFAAKIADENENIEELTEKLAHEYLNQPLTELIRSLDDIFGCSYLTLKDLLTADRSEIVYKALHDKFGKFENDYRMVYNEGKNYIRQLISLGVAVPEAYKLSARYTLSYDFNELFKTADNILDEELLQKAQEIHEEALLFKIDIAKPVANRLFSKEILKSMRDFIINFEAGRLNHLLKLFETAFKLKLNIDIREAQNIYFNNIYAKFTELLELILKSDKSLEEARGFLFSLLVLGGYLNIDTDFYKSNILKLTSPKPAGQ